ncbi:TIM barrel protein [Runella sp. MFBS21]|uniref:sugar phosphate isomerase/epimerase family protein n=1 Tax=Runella sp. MFBS21 TaxID=3034018 RepID=UPI0023F72F5B|nr:TIM barrel protein [Runella sp. MFBS21]MDF7822005.1 TIM barrel protein [Runella sp. MFBS21]
MNRRDFIKQSTALGAGIVLSSSLFAEAKRLKKFGVQLYSVRDLMPKDPKGTMKQLAEMGYTQFESYGGPDFLWGMSPKECKTFLGDLGVKMVSTHFDMNKDLDKNIERGAEAGLKYMLCPYLGPQKSLDEWKKKAELFNQVGEKVTKAGMKFGYHNHDYSFKAMEGQIPQELLLANTNPKYVMFELDLCWIVASGQNAVAHLEKYGKRYELVHIKDMVLDNGRVSQKDLGKGAMDFDTILKAAKKAGIKYYIVEQEQYPSSSIESMKVDAEWMKQLSV